MAPTRPLDPDKLYRKLDPASLPFKTTEELETLSDAFGQQRAVEAVKFGIGIRRDGYNMFALGPTGMGKHNFIRRHIEAHAAKEPVPSDWCYVNNFSEPHKPKVLRLPAGFGMRFRDEMARLVDDVKSAIVGTFESDQYRARREAIENELKERHEQAFNEVQNHAQEKNISLIRTPMGLGLAPTKDGEVLPPEEFRKLDQASQDKIKSDIASLEGELANVMRQAPNWQREFRDRIRALNREVTEGAVRHPIDDLRHRYQEMTQVLPYLTEVQEDIIENADEILAAQQPDAEGQQQPAQMQVGLRRTLQGPPVLRRYQVNVVVDHRGDAGAPVVYEDNPTYVNLAGRSEQMAMFGALFTDFNLIKPGALHRANGGYLILDARKVLLQPYAWEELKRALRSRDIRIESLAENLGWSTTVTLQPEPIPLSVKVVLIGDRMLYYLLAQADPDFSELFKVAIDFEDRIERDGDNLSLYAQLLGTIVKQESMRPLDAPAVARVVEHASRLAGDNEKLTAHIRSIADLLREADYWAHQAGRDTVTRADVQQAIDAKLHRADRIQVDSLEQITQGTVLIDTAGAKVGQVNGLSVMQIGELMFGRPTRITARIRLGRGEVVDIEREVALGGPLHSKGVLILSGFLGQRFGEAHPLALSVSLVFEQSYGGVDGDSASSTELYCILSALSDLPIKQSLAVTGSVNQRGDVQAIGGVNEKIEGYFDVCRAQGLTGEQGVMIPASNVRHLMLREDVVAACAAGKFHIYPVESIDQGIEILTGVEAGTLGPDGKWTEGSVNARAAARLAEFAELARRFGPAGTDRKEDTT
jgi:lon-related putative ATP-dependent protease